MIRALWFVLISASVAAAEDAAPKPCDTDAHRAFDFWVGTWEVHDGAGRPAGENEIVAADPCYLVENWRGKSGSRGVSLSFLDPATGKWTQDWVDSSGGRIEISGSWSDGALRLVGTHTLPDGTKRPFRGTWTPLPDGRVRQFFEEVADEKAGFQPWFDGYYTKRAAD